MNVLRTLLEKAKLDFQIDGLVHGGISSEFQKRSFEKKNLPQKIEYKKEQYQNKEKVNDLTNKILDTDCDIEAKTIGTEDGSTN